MTLENKICRHYEPKEYKDIFQEFKKTEPLNYQLIDSYIHDYCEGKGTTKDIYEQLRIVCPKGQVKQAYLNVVDVLVDLYGTKRNR